jgi:hypothetical protein
MTPDPISFAHGCGARGPCAQYVAQWLFVRGVARVPSRREIMRDWRRFGVEAGVAHWAERIGLTPCPVEPLAIALAAQPDGAPLLGVMSGDGLFVTRSFSRVLIAGDFDITKAWRV